MSVWERIVTAAVVGTERQAPDFGPAGGALGDLLARLPDDDREATLLGAAAAVSLRRLAGALPAKDEGPLPPECPPETLRTCGPRSEQHLALMLGGQFAVALTEWLAAAGSAGVVAPPGSLPGLLGRAVEDLDLTEAIHPILGSRGRWLAAQNPDWADVFETVDAAFWETGDWLARRRALRRLRGGDPARGRELVALTWAKEAPDDRAAFVELFRRRLGPDDEPFLEAALDDRRKEVRVGAAGLLASLPGSRFQARMVERLRPLLVYAPKRMLSKAHVDVRLPEGRDAAMARDGLVEQGGDGVGVRANLLRQMLAAVDPVVWSREWGATPAEIVERTDLGEWVGDLFTGWATAAVANDNGAWAEVLQRRLSAGDTRFHVYGLVRTMPPERREALAVDLFTAAGASVEPYERALHLLESCTHHWSEPFGRAVLDVLSRPVASEPAGPRWYGMRAAITTLAQSLPPSLVERAERALAPLAENPTYAETIDRTLAYLRFRREALDDLAAGR